MSSNILITIACIAQLISIQLIDEYFEKKRWKEFDEWASENLLVKGTMRKRQCVAVARTHTK